MTTVLLFALPVAFVAGVVLADRVKGKLQSLWDAAREKVRSHLPF